MSDTRMVLDVWSEFKLVVEALEGDVHKTATKGNRSAGVRVRKTVRKLRTLGAELIKATLEARDEAKTAAPVTESAVKAEVAVEKSAKKKTKSKV